MNIEKCTFENCKTILSASQAEKTKKLLGKTLCQAHAAQVSAQTAEQEIPVDICIRRLLESRGFEELQTKPGMFLKGKQPNQRFVDLTKKNTAGMPELGILEGAERITKGHGVGEIIDLMIDLEEIVEQKSGKKSLTPHSQTSVKSETKLPAVPSLRPETDLTVATIVKYIVPLATEQEAYQFLQLCKSRNLNPFLREAYLIKYSEKDAASFVVGKDAFTKRADMQPDFRGFQAGIIIQDHNENTVQREGAFITENEKLVGGWARVFRKEREPYYEQVALSEYIKKNSQGQPIRSWATMPATMIRKVALVHALREAYPQELSGMYDQSEIQEENI